MEKEDIVEYVMNTPGNTNRAVLGSMLGELNGGGGLPPVTTDDNGKILMVDEGAWAAKAPKTTDLSLVVHSDEDFFVEDSNGDSIIDDPKEVFKWLANNLKNGIDFKAYLRDPSERSFTIGRDIYYNEGTMGEPDDVYICLIAITRNWIDPSISKIISRDFYMQEDGSTFDPNGADFTLTPDSEEE